MDEAILRGASVDQVMQVLFARAHLESGTLARRSPFGAAARGLAPGQRFSLEDVYNLDERDLTDRQQRRLDQLEAMRPLIVERYDAYETLADKEFGKLPAFVQGNFKPIRTEPHRDPYSSAIEKYRAMRAAYYRAGWTDIARDLLALIAPATFFGVAIEGGVHPELARLLSEVETFVRGRAPAVGRQPSAAGFVIGGFVPRFQAASDQLSNHAYGLAIDIDAIWNPQIKTASAIDAFARATGERLDLLLRPASSIDAIRQTYQRLTVVSTKLRTWLKQWLPKYDQLQRDRNAFRKGGERNEEKAASLDREMRANPDLSALNTLIVEYKRSTVENWLAYGIVSIPAEIVEAFVELGRANRARWGGAYEHSKDVMHLELLQLAAPRSPGLPGGNGRRAPVKGLDDLVRGEARPAQRLTDGRRRRPRPRPVVRAPSRRRVTVQDAELPSRKRSTRVLRMDPIEISPEPKPQLDLDRALDFLTGRARATPHPTDPPPDVPSNPTRSTRYYAPGFPSRQVPGNQESSIKKWTYDAARYNGVPVVLIAVILQQENAPSVANVVKQLQAAERGLQSVAGQKDEQYWDLVPDKVAGGSTGIANLSRRTLRQAATYLESTYGKPVIPEAIRRDKGDPRLAGIDEQLDLYYMSALLRQLIDQNVSPNFVGNLKDDDVARVAQAYNGSGPLAEKYGRDALARLDEARRGLRPLYFLGGPPGSPPLHLQLSVARGLGF